MMLIKGNCSCCRKFLKPIHNSKPMRFLFVLVALCVAQALAAECPAPTGDLKLKQSQIQKIVEHINKPYVPDTDSAKLDVPTEGLGILDKNQVFSLFDERQWPEVEKVLQLMMAAKTFDEFIQVSDALRRIVNEDLFLFAFTSAVVHRRDTQGLNAPRVQDVYPDKFFTKGVIAQIKEAINRGNKNPVVNDTCEYWNNLAEENRLAYFTEDMGMNAHHYHWHTVNPAIWTAKLGGTKDRRGEAFYWMHRQMVNRYNCERLSLNMKRVEAFEDWEDDIDEGYSSHLTIDNTGYHYMFRPDDLHLSDLPELSKNDLRLFKSRILDTIHKGYVYALNRTRLPIPEDPAGIDLIGNLVESSRETINRPYYGNLHCYAHVIAARIADPDGKYMLDNGVMYDIATSARDSLFYQWHKFIDNIFEQYKRTLPSYTSTQVNWPEVKIDTVTVEGEMSKTPNLLTTFWDTDVFKLGKHFSFTQQSTAEIVVRHLDHEPFKYKIETVNNAGDNKEAFVRIYLAPKYDELGKPFTPDQTRRLIIELDKFTTTLKPGKNIIERSSADSSVTIPTKQIFGTAETLDTKDQCKCGWPEYLLLPRSKPEGMKFRLIVYISNYDAVKLHDDKSCMCQGAPSYCRFLYNKVIDKNTIDFPLDRKCPFRTFKELEKAIQNVHHTDIIIKFKGETLLTHE